jgi:hypothetical protein
MLKFNPRATLTAWLAEGPALKAKNLKEVEHQTSCLDMRLVFGCGIGHSQNRIGQDRREDYGKEGKTKPGAGNFLYRFPAPELPTQ